MQASRANPPIIRFGLFEVDLAASELRKRGRKVPLQEQPFKVLALLLRNPGDLVTREELQRALWPDDTFGDFDEGLNKAIQKLRQRWMIRPTVRASSRLFPGRATALSRRWKATRVKRRLR